MRVLIIEDCESLARLIATYLKPVASRIIVAKTMSEALAEIAQVEPFDLVTLDLNLPDSNVTETLAKVKEIKEHHPDCMLVIITGVPGGSGFVVEGVDGVIRKQEMGPQSEFVKTLRDIWRSITRVPVNYQRNLDLLEGLTTRLLSNYTGGETTNPPPHA